MTIQDFIYWFGYGLCHQIPERTFESGGLYFAVCARDSGIQIGFACALLTAGLRAVWLRSKHQPGEGDLPPTWALLALALLVVPMAFDGLSSYLGFRPTTNELRYLTGMLTGVAAGTLLAPLLHAMSALSDANNQAFQTPLALGIQVVAASAGALLFYLLYLLAGATAPFIAPFLEIIALLTLVASLNLVVLSVTLIKKRFEHLKQWLPWIGIALVLSLVEIALFDALRFFVFQPFLGQAGIWSTFSGI